MVFSKAILFYILWHYGGAFRDLFRIYTNYAWFLYHYFSLGILAGTMLDPWKRLKASKKEEGGILGKLILDFISRAFGIIARTLVLSVGILSEALLGLLLIASLILWILAPALLVYAFYYGIKLAFI